MAQHACDNTPPRDEFENLKFWTTRKAHAERYMCASTREDLGSSIDISKAVPFVVCALLALENLLWKFVTGGVVFYHTCYTAILVLVYDIAAVHRECGISSNVIYGKTWYE